MTARVGPGREAAGVTVDHVFGALDLDPAATDRPDDDLVARGQTSVLENADGQRHLVLSGNLTHRFTILAVSKGSRFGRGGVTERASTRRQKRRETTATTPSPQSQ